jgi:hypothetical protein
MGCKGMLFCRKRQGFILIDSVADNLEMAFGLILAINH